MSDIAISPFRLLDSSLPCYLQVRQQFSFTSSGPAPCARNVGGQQYSLGTDSDWTAENHDLVVNCIIELPLELNYLFGNDGIAANDATILLALEWTSADSGSRQLGSPMELSLKEWPTESFTLSIRLAAGTIRGVGAISLEFFLGHPGTESRTGIATQRGFRFGTLGPTIAVIIDGDSSLFPILEQSCGVSGALWEFRECWIDPREDEFSSDYVSLVLNTDHEQFEHLHERRGNIRTQTPLMKQVLASWITLLVFEVKVKLDRDFTDLVHNNGRVAESYSIAETAAGFVRTGELDTSSLAALFASTQRWLDQRVKEAEVAG